jgi:hypothetical protein
MHSSCAFKTLSEDDEVSLPPASLSDKSRQCAMTASFPLEGADKVGLPIPMLMEGRPPCPVAEAVGRIARMLSHACRKAASVRTADVRQAGG